MFGQRLFSVSVEKIYRLSVQSKEGKRREKGSEEHQGASQGGSGRQGKKGRG